MVVECSLMVDVSVHGGMLTMIDSSRGEKVLLSTLYHINYFLLSF
jgi:hypothetical protein